MREYMYCINDVHTVVENNKLFLLPFCVSRIPEKVELLIHHRIVFNPICYTGRRVCVMHHLCRSRFVHMSYKVARHIWSTCIKRLVIFQIMKLNFLINK